MQGYKQLLQAYYAGQGGNLTQLQHTILMVLPSTINLAFVPSSDKTDKVGLELGVGYARLGVQLIACWMRLHRVWLMDDNVQDCYRLEYQHMLQHHKHKALKGQLCAGYEDSGVPGQFASQCKSWQYAFICTFSYVAPVGVVNFLACKPVVVQPHAPCESKYNPVAPVYVYVMRQACEVRHDLAVATWV